jgi:hypothetical protein
MILVKGCSAVVSMEVTPTRKELRLSLEKILDLALGIARGLGDALRESIALDETLVGPTLRKETPDEGVEPYLEA